MVSIDILMDKIANLEKENSLLRGHVHRLNSKQDELISRIACLENGYNGLADALAKLDVKLGLHIEDYKQRVFAVIELGVS